MRAGEAAAARCIQTPGGAGPLDPLFGELAKVLVPWPGASRSKHRHRYDPEMVGAALQGPHWVLPIDPRTLRATQPWVTRAGFSHHLSGSYERTGITFADRHSAADL